VATTASINNVYLISGFYDAKNGLQKQSAELISDRVIVLRDPKGAHSLNHTDERGMITTINAKGDQLHPVQRNPLAPLSLSMAPPGTLRDSVAAFGEAWQKSLVERVRSVGVATDITTIPVKFTKEHLRPAETKEDKAAFEKLGSGELCGQLIPKVRCLLFLFEQSSAAHAPSKMTLKCGSRSVATVPLGTRLSLDLPGKGEGSYHVMAAMGPELEEGHYTASVPASEFKKSLVRSSNGNIKRSFEVAFAIKSVFFDVDVHVFEMPTLESAILLHFGDRYPHLAQGGEDDEGPKYEAALGSVQKVRANASLLVAKQKLVTGLLPPDGALDGKKKVLQAYLLDIASKALPEFLPRLIPPGTPENTLAVVKSAYGAYKSYRGALETWSKVRKDLRKVLIEMLDKQQRATLKLNRNFKTIDLLFHPNTFQKAKSRAMAAANDAGSKALFKAGLIEESTLSASLRRRMQKEALTKSLRTFEQKALSAVAGSLAAVDVAMTIEEAVKALKALADANSNKDLQQALLAKGMSKYSSKYSEAPNLSALSKLEGLRRMADAGNAGVDAAESELVQQSAAAVMGIITLIPVVGEVAAVVGLAFVAKDFAFEVLDLASDAIDRFGFRHRASGSRLLDLGRQHATSVRALPKEMKAGDAMVQWQSRVIAIIGLLRLIERLGGYHQDEARFRRKVEEYQIKKYIDTYILSSKPFKASIYPGMPLDEIWLFACGNNDTAWNESIAAIMSASSYSFSHAFDNGAHYAEFGQKHRYPIEGLESASSHDLAKSFSVEFSGVIDGSFTWAAVYVKDRKSRQWVRADKVNFAIGPRDPVRVVAAFRARSATQNLTGVPVSLQLVRADKWMDNKGPVYKTSLAKSHPGIKWCQGDGDDKGLLAGNPEEEKVANDPSGFYAVFHPFYFHRSEMLLGLKPFGHIPLSGDPSYKVAFDILAGEDARDITHNGKTVELNVHMDLKNGSDVGMLLNREFLAKKSHEKSMSNIFDFPYQEVVTLGVAARLGGKWVEAQKDSTIDLSRTRAWGSSLDFVFVFGARFTALKNWSESTAKFPSKMLVREPHLFSDDLGPSYPTDVVCLEPSPRVAAWSWREVFSKLLQLKAATDSDLEGEKDFKRQLSLKEPMVTFACYVPLHYSIEAKAGGGMLSRQGLKPFTDKLGQSSFEYKFGLNAPAQVGLGDKLDTAFTVIMPSFDASILSGTAFEGNPSFVTDKRYYSALEIEKALP
jgi:hypothetical protein